MKNQRCKPSSRAVENPKKHIHMHASPYVGYQGGSRILEGGGGGYAHYAFSFDEVWEYLKRDSPGSAPGCPPPPGSAPSLRGRAINVKALCDATAFDGLKNVHFIE